jgi:hypothetical protein
MWISIDSRFTRQIGSLVVHSYTISRPRLLRLAKWHLQFKLSPAIEATTSPPSVDFHQKVIPYEREAH